MEEANVNGQRGPLIAAVVALAVILTAVVAVILFTGEEASVLPDDWSELSTGEGVGEGVPTNVDELNALLTDDSLNWEAKYHELEGFASRQNYESAVCSVEIHESRHTAKHLRGVAESTASPPLRQFFEDYIGILGGEGYLKVIDKIHAGEDLTENEATLRDELSEETYALYVSHGVILGTAQAGDGYGYTYCSYPIPGLIPPEEGGGE